MMYLVSAFTLVTSANGVELRQLAFDVTNDKVTSAGHGLADGNYVLYQQGTGGTPAVQGGLSTDTVYVVDGKTDNDFKLKTFKADDGTGENAVTITDATAGTWSNTMTVVGAKKCKLASSDNTANTVTCADPVTFQVADKLIVYCTDAGGADTCLVDGTANAALANLSEVYAKTADSATTELSAESGGDAIPIAVDMPAASQNKIWLLSKSATVLYPVTTAAPSAGAGAATRSASGVAVGTTAFLAMVAAFLAA